MRTLVFRISGQSIERDAACKFNGLVPGTKGYLRAAFTFDEEWNGLEKIAVFTSYGKEIPRRLINNAVMIPDEILETDSFFISVIGIRPDFRIQTSRIGVRQDG